MAGGKNQATKYLVFNCKRLLTLKDQPEKPAVVSNRLSYLTRLAL